MTAIGKLVEHLYEGGVVDTADLARVSDTNPRSVARWRTQQTAPRREAEERLLELRAVVDLARRIIREDAIRLWLRSPDPDLGYRKPLDVIASGEYQRVIDLLLALAEGVTS
ncbi:antitoxin Xre/MbcA/ParS toxin-binding domain-containing protein [Candidatus Poriferisodalis sp.]|uniref:antitoxin Xre/MbcA/ParS toxin-binding domain-containing protein n=1 Tax=Candidatus Poriferisodalis sp. TaxID=3101277 RepID=UPI003B5CC380